MNNRELIIEAEKIIGEHSSTDYILQAGFHANEYEKKAPEFARLLRSTKLESIRKEYEIWDTRALENQKTFRRWSSNANLFAFLTVMFTALILALATFNKDNSLMKFAIFILTTLGITSSVVAGAALRQIKNGNLLHAWMSSRATAETARIDYFKEIINFRLNETDVLFSLLKLEYYKANLLDKELNYYTDKSKQNNVLANKTLSYSTWLLAGATLTTAIGGYAGHSSNLIAITSLAVIFQALSSKISNKAAFYQYGKNAESFERTRSTLARLRGRLDDVRDLVASGDNNALIEYTSLINEQISLEHRLWIDSFNERITTIDKMVEEMKNKQT